MNPALGKDRLGKFKPRTGTGVRHMIKTVTVGSDQIEDSCSQIRSVRRRANLIVDDPQGLAGLAEAEHRLNKVGAFAAPAPGAIQAAGPQHEVLGTERAYQVFTGQFAQAINAERT